MVWKCQALNKKGKQCSRNASEKGCHLYCTQHSEVLDKTLDDESLKNLTNRYDNAFNTSITGLKKNGIKKF